MSDPIDTLMRIPVLQDDCRRILAQMTPAELATTKREAVVTGRLCESL